jgi:hypothetical protein
MHLSVFHVYHNNCAPRFFHTYKEAEEYAEKIMQQATDGYTGTKYIKPDSSMKISFHKFMRRNDPNEVVVQENMYNLNRIMESNEIYNARQQEQHIV